MAFTKIDDKIRRVDAVAKARGEAVYVCDMNLDGMLYAQMLRSTCPRGKILSLDIPTLPDGYYFVSAKDIPEGGKNELWMIMKDWRCFAEGDVRFVGDCLGVFVGKSRQVLKSLVANTRVEYEEETPAVTIDDAVAVKGGPILTDKGNDIHCQLYCEKGRPMDEVFAEADDIIEETIETGFQEHVHLETNSVLAMPENDYWVIYASAQCPFYIRKATAGLLGVPMDKIHVRQQTTGGAFGGKENFPDVLAGPALIAAYVTGKPVKLVFDREEDMEFSVKRHPSKVVYKTAVKDGHVTGTKQIVYYNCGAYLSSSFVVLQRGVFHSTGVYDVPNAYVDGYGMATNTYPSDAFRGFGVPRM